MQLKQKKNTGKLTAAILLAGCCILTTVDTGMAEGTKVQLDFSKIQQALHQGATTSGGTSTPALGVNSGQMLNNTVAPTVKSMANSMQAGSTVIGTKDPEINQVIKETLGGNIMTSDIMAEMQKKIMGENMGSMQETIQASVMKNMQGSIQQSAKDSMTTK